MSTTNQTKHLLQILETLPGAMFVLDDTDTIVYANASAQSITGTTPEEVVGTSLWGCAPHLVSASLYQAVQQAKQTREPTDVAYASPVTQRLLHVHLAPTEKGLTLLFQEESTLARHQETLLAHEHHAVAVLNDVQIRFALLTPEGILLEINETPLDQAHIRCEKVLGKPLAEAPWWSSAPASQKRLRAAIQRASTGETVRFEAPVRPREGMVLHIEHVITPHIDADHHIAYLIIAGIDITARTHAEAEIHTLIDTIPQLVWTGRPDGFVDYYNQRWRGYTGLSAEEAQGNGWMQCTHPDDRQRIRVAWRISLKTGTPFETEQRLRHGTTGAYHRFLVRAVPMRDEAGQIVKWFGTCTDIEEQKQAEQRLKESRENWRMLAETVPQLVWTTRPDGRVDYVNQRYCDYTQATLEQIRDDGWHQIVHPEDIERTLALRRQTLATGEPYEIEYRLKNSKTGTSRWFLTRALPMCNEAGDIIKWFGTSTDIDDQKCLEESLHQSQEQVHALIHSNIIGIDIAEGEQIVDANDTYLRMTGYTREDLRAGCINWMQMTPPEDMARTLQAHQELDTQQSMMPYEKEYVCKDGSRLPVVVGRVALPSKPSQAIGFVLDNSARKELDQRKDDFINMASHELRTPLTAVKMQTQIVRKRLERQSHHEAATALSRVEEPIKQLERLVEELLDVSKIQAGRLEYRQQRVDLNALLREITDTLQHIHPSYTILLYAAVQVSLMGDRDRLGQIFTNLISNAIKYSPDAKTVEVDLDATEDAVTVYVRDHGLGIPREQRDKIFERFYRVAGPCQRGIAGLGMGLYIVGEIVKYHGGTITVESAVGKGSTFMVTLPLTRDA